MALDFLEQKGAQEMAGPTRTPLFNALLANGI